MAAAAEGSDASAAAAGSGAGEVVLADFRMPLKDKVCCVTGGGSGIGAATCLMFAERGGFVFVLDLNEESAGAIVKQITDAGGEAMAIACDVSKKDSVDAVFETIKSTKGRVDVMVNNAGIGSVGDVIAATEEEFDRLYNVNVKGMFFCLQATVKLMLETGGGSIINIGSIASKIGLADRFSYSMTKGAVLTMTLSVATDYVKKGIRCNCVCPARVHTQFVDSYLAKNYPGEEEAMFKKLSEYQPIGRMAKPEEVAALISFLACDDSKFITGSSYSVDGGVVAVM